MTISRAQMRRQLRQNGGIMDVTPREKFGIGSSIKRAFRKIIPNEVADIAVKAAPFVAPFNPAAAAAMAGLGSFDQTGSISGALKSGALTYGGGQLARYAGGAGFQQNPFTEGGAFRGGLEGFKGGFSSPLGTKTGFKLGKTSQPVTGVQEVATPDTTELGKQIADQGIVNRSNVLAGQPVPGADPAVYVKQSAFPEKFIPVGMGDTGVIDTRITDTVVKDFSPKTFLQDIFSGDPAKIGNALKEGAKKAGDAIFYKEGEGGKRVLDKTALLAAGSFGLSYLDAKKIADEAGVDIGTKEEYDEATKAEKQKEYEGYLKNFFGGRKEGGRIGFNSGSRPTQLFKLLEEAQAAGDDDKVQEIKSDLFREFGLKLAKGGRINLKEGTEPKYGTEEYFKQNLDKLNLDELIEKPYLLNPFTIGMIEERLGDYEKVGGDASSYKDKYEIVKQKNAEYFQGLSEEDQKNYLKRNKEMLEKDLDLGIFPDQENLGVLGIEKETDSGFKIPAPKKDKFDIQGFKKYRLDVATGGRIGAKDGYRGKSRMKDFKPIEVDPLMGSIDDMLEGDGGVPLPLMVGMKNIKKAAEAGKQIFSSGEKTSIIRQLAGRLKGSDAYKELGKSIPEIKKVMDEPLKYLKDAAILKEILKLKKFVDGGRVMKAMGSEVPLRTNGAGIEELDYRDSGGFVPIGIKEKADDVPAMLSKNEFVMTADAVRGIGNGDVEKGAETLYGIMKQAEKVGQA